MIGSAAVGANARGEWSAHARSAAAIRAECVSHRYGATRNGPAGQVPVLENISLQVGAAELVAILGPSGCGKSTLVRILAGLLEPSEGTALLDGGPPRDARRARRVGWLAQDDGLLPWMSVAANVALPLTVGGRLSGIEVAERVDRILADVGLADAAQHFPHELSGGMRQRAGLARALVTGPSILLLDEPFAHLDEITRERLGDLLSSMRKERAPATVLVTHSIEEALRLADRVVVLSRKPGRIRLDEPVPLPWPRAVDQPGYGSLARYLKVCLADAASR